MKFSASRLRPPRTFSQISSLLAAVLGVTGCQVYEAKPWEEMTELAPSEAWVAGGEQGEVADGWIAAFNDPELIELVAIAQEGNPDLAAVAATLSAAISQAQQANAALWPTLNLGANAAREHRFDLTQEQQQLGLKKDRTRLGASLDLSWEIDVWNRLSSAEKGASLAAQATAADYAAARQSLAGQVAKSWFQTIVAKQQWVLAQEFVVNFAQAEEIAQARFNAGDVSAQDTYTAKADLAATQQAEAEAQTAYRAAIRSLEILLGRYPSDKRPVADQLPEPPGPVPAGIPSRILERRHDVIAAERQVASAFQFARSAAAARLPQFGLTGSLGAASDSLNTLFDPSNILASLGANLFQPLFDAGLRKSQFEEAEANQAVAVASYKATALNAFAEVEDALDSDQSLKRQVFFLDIAATNYEKARVVGEVRYREGETSLTDFLVVQRQSLQAQSQLITAKGQFLTNRVDLHLALGGNFESGPINETPEPPPLPTADSSTQP